MITFLQFLESYKLEDQTFSDNNGTYKVSDLYSFVKSNKQIQNIEIKKLLHNLEPSPEETGEDLPGHPDFVKRAKAAKLVYPIIVVNYPDGLWIADGVHRLWKAKALNHKTIRGYIMNQSELKNLAPH